VVGEGSVSVVVSLISIVVSIVIVVIVPVVIVVIVPIVISAIIPARIILVIPPSPSRPVRNIGWSRGRGGRRRVSISKEPARRLLLVVTLITVRGGGGGWWGAVLGAVGAASSVLRVEGSVERVHGCWRDVPLSIPVEALLRL
jgi:hypothetical protein